MANPFGAQYFDGRTAASHQVRVRFSASGLLIEHDSANTILQWPFSGLTAIERPQEGHPLRLSHSSEKSARLIVPPGPAQTYILNRAPQLRASPVLRRALRFAGFAVGSLACVVIIGYAILNLAPQLLSDQLPLSWRERLADQTERSLLKDTKRCHNPAGKQALSRLASRVAAAADEPVEFSLRVYDMPIINAFAMPAGRVVMTGALIRQADSPEELAGVLAHELGHVEHRHPEAQLVRVVGIQLVLSIATGGGGGDQLGSLAGIFAILRYTRSAEEQADDYALELMERGDIDPKGLRQFFEKLSKKSGEGASKTLDGLTDMLSTHPLSRERVEYFKPMAPGQARPVVSAAEWQAIKRICS